MSELSEAIRNGDAARLEALLDSHPAALHEAEEGVTPLLLALYHGRAELAQLLVARGATVSFGEACALGDLDRVRRQLHADPSLLDTRTPDGYPPLGLAIFFRHPDVAAFLIERGADVHAAAQNANNVAPVHAAAAVCDHETMRLLLARGADPNARQQLDYTALHGAASRGDLEMARLLVEHGADANAQGSDGLTPADIARKYGKSWL